jgi:hypothetical protein
MSLDWLSSISANEVAYIVAIVVGAVALVVIAVKSRDLTTTTLALMAVAIAINIGVGSLVSALKLPIYLDSIGTVLVGALAGPWAGALTGLLSNLIWSLLPVPGGAGPIGAFFAPVAAVIGLMAGFWGARGVFQMRTEDSRVGGFLALAVGLAAALLSFSVLQAFIATDMTTEGGQNLFVTLSITAVVLGVVVAWLSGRTVFAFRPSDPRVVPYLRIAATTSAFLLVFGLLRLLFQPTGWFSTLDGSATTALPGTDLTGLAIADPVGLVGALMVAILVALGAWKWASRGENARLFPVWVGGVTTGVVAAMMSAPISAGVFGGVTGSGTDALVALYRTLGFNVFASAFAQGLTSDPLDKTISFTIVFFILGALPVTVRTMFSRGETTILE